FGLARGAAVVPARPPRPRAPRARGGPGRSWRVARADTGRTVSARSRARGAPGIERVRGNAADVGLAGIGDLAASRGRFVARRATARRPAARAGARGAARLPGPARRDPHVCDLLVPSTGVGRGLATAVGGRARL